MCFINRLKTSVLVGTSAAVMLTGASSVNNMSFMFFSRLLPSFAFSRQQEKTEQESVEYRFALWDLIKCLWY